MNRLKQIGKDSLIYGIGGFASKAISFLLLPVYTRIFPPADYGTIEMLVVISSFLSAFLEMGMNSAQSFYFFERKNKGKTEQARIISSVLQWRILWGAVIIIIGTILSPFLNNWFFNGSLSWVYFGIAFIGVFFSQIMNQSVEIFRLVFRPWPYIGVSLLQTIGAAGFILLLILEFNMGILGFFIGTLMATIIAAIVGWYLTKDYLNFTVIHSDLWGKLLRFGIPLLPSGVAIYAMSTADRWFIQYYHGGEQLGLYAIGSKFAIIIAIGIETFRKAWWPMALDAMHTEDGPETFQVISRLFLGMGVALVIVLTFMSPWLVRWLTDSAFHTAWPIVGILTWKSLFFGFFLIGSAGIWKSEKTYLNMIISTGAAVVGILLNFLLVPKYEVYGAALSTSVTYLLWIIVSIVISERLWKVGFPFKVFAFQIVVGIVYVIWYLIYQNDQQLFLQGSISLIACMILVFYSVKKKDRQIIFSRINK